MALSNSIAGRLGSSLWRQNPLLGVGLAFGAGAGIYAGAHTFLASDGSIVDRAKESASSGSNYFKYSAGAAILGLTAAPWVVGRTGGYAAGRTLRAGKDYGSHLRRTFSEAKGFGNGLRALGEQRFLMTGLGAGIGAAIGSHLDKEHPGKGAAKGAAIGGGAGLALSAGLRAASIWKKIGPVGQVGAIGLLSAAAFAGGAALTKPKYSSMSEADPSSYGIQGRMSSMNATGDLVLGLHNSR